MTAVGVLESEGMKYIASVLDSLLRQVKEMLLSVENGLFPSDPDRAVVTFGAERVRKDSVIWSESRSPTPGSVYW